ncbi:MAG: DUF979 domain-containing protein [Frankiales bacterium]|nr:DUF979 domain-containing protein [Frankiales bacterium]
MIKVEWFYWLIAVFFLAVGFMVLRDRSNPNRIWSGAFWSLLGLCFSYSSFVVAKTAPGWPLGLAIVAIAGIAGFGKLSRGTQERTTTPEERETLSARFGNKLFLPVLVVPVVTGVFAILGPKISIGGRPVLEPLSETVIGLGASAIIAVAVGMWLLRTPHPAVVLHEGRRLTETIGWAAILPQLLAMLGLVFATAGVGKAIGTTVENILPKGSLIAAVALYCLGMAVFTAITGNAFAAFPVMTAAIGYPLLVEQYHGTAAAVFAIGMLSGYCGTLLTPMAANFNIVPVALLGLKSDWAVIRAQIPTAVPLLAANIGLMYYLAF